MYEFEKLGLFYLGRQRTSDLAATEELLLYDSKDLTTHAVCVGMTGSGKTGLCLALLEEAAMDNIPAIVIDPKGDIANLLLTFPELSAANFRDWVDESQAARAGLTVDQFAADQARLWKDGLAAWQIEGQRIQTLREKVDLPIYTPGSNAGLPITVLRSFDVPPEAVRQDSDAFVGHIASAASGLLALLGIEADPVTSREHILVSKILEMAWTSGRNLDLANLIREIQNPPFKLVGILELERFYPTSDRMSLAMQINNLLASPSFATWLEGEPLDIKRMLHTPEGKPKISIMSISHLPDSQRMFFVTTLLNEVLSWMRTQAGTSSLRAILYMDEVFGYFPPIKNPPSKIPMLTLLKQARAYGLGIVLATQNPVDLDYKGLSNTGTWFLGRLQTERDKARVLDGLEGASAATGASFDRQKMERVLSGLGKRMFVLNNVHEDGPVLFETRWAMSYLRGPLTRTHIQKLMENKKAELNKLHDEQSVVAESLSGDASTSNSSEAETVSQINDSFVRPNLPNAVQEYYLPPNQRVGTDSKVVYKPSLFGASRLHFSKASYNVDHWQSRIFAIRIADGVPDDIWDHAMRLDPQTVISRNGAGEEAFLPVPDTMLETRNYERWEKEFKSFLYRTQELTIYKCSELKQYSDAGESKGDFKVRLEQSVSEKRDLETEKLRKKYAGKFSTLKSQLQRAEQAIAKEKGQYESKKVDSFLSFGSSILGAVFGRKLASKQNVSRATSSARSVSRAAKERGDIGRAEDRMELLKEKQKDLEHEFENAIAAISEKLDVNHLQLEELTVNPRKSDISVTDFGILWLPHTQNESGVLERVFELKTS
jgi:hypothetical protein